MTSTGRVAILLCLMFLLPLFQFSQTPIDYYLNDDKEYQVETFSHSGLVDVETWQINDNWMYSGYLDVIDFITSSGISTNIEYLYGTLDQTVTEIYISNIDNQSSLTYKVESIGTYGAEDVELDGQTGDISVNMDTIEIIRASDMATVSQEATVEIVFCANIFWWCVDIDVADLLVNNTYYPALEGLDFPLNVGESWVSDYHMETSYSGSSNYVDIPNDSEDENTSSWEIVSQGFSGVSYTGCGQSYNITTYDSDGIETGYRWYCPAIRGDVKSSFTQSFGFNAVHELVAYQPTSRNQEISIHIEYPLSPTDINISAWINVTNQGNPLSELELEFRYEIEDDIRNVLTDENGSYHLEFNTGNNTDTSFSQDDLSSNGVLVWTNLNSPILGAVTVTTNLNIHEIDLVTRTEGVTVERTRNNSTITLDPNVGFTATFEDELVFSVPVVNRGLSDSPQSNLRIDSPDGNIFSVPVMPLASLQESRVEVNWTVPMGQSFGLVYLEFLVDPEETITEDGNKSNNYGIFSLFIGDMPNAVLNHDLEVLTIDEVILNGQASNDPDGGTFMCEFQIEISEDVYENYVRDDCIHQTEWSDDGEYDIFLTIIDEENDQSTIKSSILVINRPPEITITSHNYSIPVLSEVTFEITERIDLDTQSPNSPIDILWNNATCLEGQIGIKCTIIPLTEGEFVIDVSATDDDGAITYSSSSVLVTNIAPYSPSIEIWAGPNKVIPDSRGVYVANEGEIITLKAWALDSNNDINNLSYIWHPDAENSPQIQYINQGIMGEINYTYGFAGLQLATLEIFDDDNASTIFANDQHTLIIPIEIQNVDPSIISISPRSPVEEGEELIFNIGIIDTLNDMDNLITCFDINPLINADSLGSNMDDCDFNSTILSYAWEDSTSAPDFIVFHVTDDDGSTDYAEIDIDVRNTRPKAIAKLDDLSPLQGEFISLSANGTIDSDFDIENMIYHWDTDTSFDSDGDGNPSNDVDMIGRWVQVMYSKEGKKVVKLTVYDEIESNSITMIVEVGKAPFNLEKTIKNNTSSILLLILISSIVLFMSIRYKQNLAEKPIKKSSINLNIDELFDDKSDEDVQNEKSENMKLPNNPKMNIMDENLNINSNLSINKIPDSYIMENEISSLNDILNEQDIEALFEE